MSKKETSPDLFSQPVTEQEKQSYINGWNDALNFIAERFDQFPFPLDGKDILKSLLPEIPD